MKAKVTLALILLGTAVMAILAILRPPSQPAIPEPQPPGAASLSKPPDPPPQAIPAPSLAPRPLAPPATETAIIRSAPKELAPSTNKLERLTQIRESFRALAAGDPTAALRAAKQITDDTERETALLTLVTEWTHGELGPSRDRARAIAAYGLEAGLGMELAKTPNLALLWANELTDPPGRTAVLQGTAIALLGSDPAAAFALSDQIPQADRPKFFEALISGWAEKDTDAALQWANELPDPAQQAAALDAIHSVAPVGIGAALGIKDGYPVINQLLPGTPAELSGQLHPGDRIVALAQGYNSFVDAHSVSLPDIVQMIRGSPGTLLQLQVLPAEAPPNSQPRTVAIIRDQLKFKR